MKSNKFIGLGLLVVLSLLFPLVSAAMTMNVPVAAGNYTEDITWSITTTMNATMNMTCYYNVTGGEVSMSDILGSLVANTSEEQKTFTLPVTISSYTDAATYNVSCAARNNSEAQNVSRTGLTFDSTEPVVTLFVSFEGGSQSYDGLLDYSCTTADAIDGSPTETFAVAHPSGDETSSTSLTLQSTILTFGDTNYEGDYVFTCTSTDYTSNIGTDSKTVTIDSAGYPHIVGGEKSGTSKWVWIVIIGVVVWLIYNAKKKRN